MPPETAPYPAVRRELTQGPKWRERLRTPARPGRRKIGGLLDDFLASYLVQVNGGVRKLHTYQHIQERLKHFRKLHGEATVDTINGEFVRGYYNSVIGLNISGHRQHNLFRAVKTFILWCYHNEYLDSKPRNLEPQYRWEFSEHLKSGRRLSPSEQQDQLFTKTDVKLCLDNLSPAGQCYVLLALNCAFTQADLSALRKSEVDLDAGRIVYTRAKTMRTKSAPVIKYKLWKATVKALRATRSDHPELWFQTREGNPLKTSKVVGGRASESNVVSRLWQDWQKEGKVPNKQYKQLRKTGATLIGDSPYRPWVELYLGDVPHTVAGCHYGERAIRLWW
jgi:integrase